MAQLKSFKFVNDGGLSPTVRCRQDKENQEKAKVLKQQVHQNRQDILTQLNISAEEDENDFGSTTKVFDADVNGTTRVSIQASSQHQALRQQHNASPPSPHQIPTRPQQAEQQQQQQFQKTAYFSLGAGSEASASLHNGRPIAALAADTNHFEIRWQNINLRASSSSSTSNLASRLARPSASLGGLLRKFGASDEKKSPPIDKSSTSNSTPTLKAKQQQQQQQNLGKQILANVSGSVFSGQLTAILGPSGVGKTTLLNSLTGRNTLEGSGRVSLVGGASKRMSVLTVPQTDVLPAKLTAMEDLQFTSRLKNPQKGFDHDANIARIVRHLQMTKFLETRIERLSGGEARRLSIGRELLSSPDIMILDEPTSGLDANTCRKIIAALRDIVEHSATILDRPMCMLVTIHQPQQEVLQLFHRCYVMAFGGRAIFEGPASNIMPTLLEHSSLTDVRNAGELNENPAVVIIEVASGEFGERVIDELDEHHANQLADAYVGYDTDGWSPYQTPLSVRTPMSTRVSQRCAFGALVTQKAAAVAALSSYNNGLQTQNQNQNSALPHLPQSQLNALAAAENPDTLSAASHDTSFYALSTATTAKNSKLKVDKRLRRSLVMESDLLGNSLVLMHRNWLLNTRNALLMFIRVVGFILVAAGIVQIFGGALSETEHGCPMYETQIDDISLYLSETRARLNKIPSIIEQGLQTHMLFFHLLLCISMVTSAITGLAFPMQLRMFLREYKNGWYSVGSFLLSTTISELPIDMLGPIICTVIFYPLCGQPTSAYYWREFGYAFIVILVALVCKSQAQIIGSVLVNSIENSVFMSCVMVAPPALLSGIAVRLTNMYYVVRLATYFSFLRYGFEAMFVLRFGFNMCACDTETVNGYPTAMSGEAAPARLENFARGLLDLSTPLVADDKNLTLLVSNSSSTTTTLSPETTPLLIKPNESLFGAFVQLLTEANNLFQHNAPELGSCTSYRSLYLIDYNFRDELLLRWTLVLILMFLLSRALTYLVVKTVIRLRLVAD